MLLAGEIPDGATVKLSVSHGRLTINGKEVGGEAEVFAPEVAFGRAVSEELIDELSVWSVIQTRGWRQ